MCAFKHVCAVVAARDAPDWSALLVDAVNKSGVLSTAYSRFWNYSVGNQLVALFTCMARKIEPGPIHTFRGWLELGRHVRKGERAISLCMPIQVNRRDKPESGGVASEEAVASSSNVRTVFVLRPRWFVLSQTDGEPYAPVSIPAWDETAALQSLVIEREPFRHLDGNAQGYAVQHRVAVSPIASLPHKTLFHELAHVQLGHTDEVERLDEHEITEKHVREVEAECVALICCESLDLPGAAECRGYIQHWLQGQQIPPRSAQKIFKAADAILKAGLPKSSSDSEVH